MNRETYEGILTEKGYSKDSKNNGTYQKCIEGLGEIEINFEETEPNKQGDLMIKPKSSLYIDENDRDRIHQDEYLYHKYITEKRKLEEFLDAVENRFNVLRALI